MVPNVALQQQITKITVIVTQFQQSSTQHESTRQLEIYN